MDIDYLLWLQNLRESAGPALEQAAYLLTAAALVAGPALVAVLYWCFDRKKGIAGLFALGCGQAVNNLIKVTACVYRPWIKSALVTPSELALDGATGYSFPSGHTMIAATTLGSVAWQFRKRAWVVAVCTVVILLCAGSRNLLGVHAPQDVLVAIAESLIIVLACAKAVPALEAASPSGQAVALACVLAFCVVAAAYVGFKPYPVDYVDGALLVDPAKMRLDAYKGIGFLAGLSTGWFLERRLVRFDDAEARGQRMVRLICGLVVTGAVYLVASALSSAALPDAAAMLVKGAAPMIAGVFLAPAAFTWIERVRASRKAG